MNDELSEAEWLASLRPGDEVIVRSGYGYPVYQLATVARRTPSGRIIAGDAEFNANGRLRGADRYSSTRIVQPSSKLRELAERRALLARLSVVTWSALDTATLRAIVALLPTTNE